MHHVVVVGERLHNDEGAVVGTHGFYVDVSPAPLPEQMREDALTAKLAEITENRAGIEQAKGMLMLVYRIGEDAAFNLLKWLSQEANVKLRVLAEQVCEDFRSSGQFFAVQSEFDQLLLTAHLRVRSAAVPLP